MGGGDDIFDMTTQFNPTTKAQFQSVYANGIISMGSGSDILTIASGITVNGSLQIGADYYADNGSADGDDVVNILGTSQVTGNISMGSGADTLNLSPTGSIGGYVHFE